MYKCILAMNAINVVFHNFCVNHTTVSYFLTNAFDCYTASVQLQTKTTINAEVLKHIQNKGTIMTIWKDLYK